MSRQGGYREHSKSTLLRAAQILFDERKTIEATLRRRWLRRVVAAAIVALVLGFGLGTLAAPRLTAVQVGRMFVP